MRDLVGRAEALSALTTTVGQCTKLPNARTKVHNAIAVMSWKCFMGSGVYGFRSSGVTSEQAQSATEPLNF